MSLKYAILGFLNYHPYTGYDLKKIFDTTVKHFWTADQSQIYRTLSQLTNQGYVKMEVMLQVDRPDRKVYSITPSGQSAWLDWLSKAPETGETRSAALIQVFFAGELSDSEILAKFEGYAAWLRLVLTQYEKIPEATQPYQQEIGSAREHFFWMLTLENGLRGLRANLEWAESVIERIQNGQIPPK